MKHLIPVLLALSVPACLSAQPSITGFAPAAGAVGSTVVISGSGFSTTPTNNFVYFGTTQAQMVTSTANSLTVIVPAGTSYQPLTVTKGGLTAYSNAAFDVTFPGGGTAFTPVSFLSIGGVQNNYIPYCAVAADFNGDGKLDFVGTTQAAATFTVFENISYGKNLDFLPTSFNTTGAFHKAAAAGDIDGDGKPDLVLTNTNPASISVYLNTTGSTQAPNFAANLDFPSNNYPFAAAIGDLDGDGKADIAIADYSGGVVSLYRNTGTPGNIAFAERVDIPAGTGPNSIAIVDVDGDGKPDLAITNSSGVAVLKNASTAGSFSFGAPQVVASLTGLTGVAAGDLDGDGKLDLCAADPSSNNLVLVRNTGSPGTVSFASVQTLPALLSPESIVLGDMDGHGKPDLVSQGINPLNAISIYRNTSVPGSLSFETHSDYSTQAGVCFFAAIGDLDGNGRPDIMTNTFSVLSNMVGVTVPVIGSFSPTIGVTGTVITIRGTGFTGTTGVSFGQYAAQSFSVVSDSVLTAVVGLGQTGAITVTNANASGTAYGFSFYAPMMTDFYPKVADRGDTVRIKGSYFTNIDEVRFGNNPAASFIIDSMTQISAIVGGGYTGPVEVISPNGSSMLSGFTFSPPVINSYSPASGIVGSQVTITGKNFTTAIGAADFVWFGSVQAPVISADSHHLTVRVPAGADYQPLSVSTNNLTAYYTSPFVVTWPGGSPAITSHSFHPAGSFATGANPSDMVITDLDRDGRPDMVTLDEGAGNFSVLMNHSSIGHVSFGAKADFTAGTYPRRIAAADLNGDGQPDIVILDSSAGNYYPTGSALTILTNGIYQNVIGWDAMLVVPTANTAQGLCLADVNGDGRADILVCSPSTGTFSVFPNTTLDFGPISFGQRIDFPNPDSCGFITAADLDGDGKPEVIMVSSSGKVMSIARNTSAGGVLGFAPVVDFATNGNPAYVAAGDFDGDGKPDLVTGSTTGGAVSWFRNLSTAGSIALGARQDSILSTTNALFADLNGDGKVDAGFGAGSGAVTVMQNYYGGSGMLSFAPSVVVPATAANNPVLLFSADLDGDSKPDLAVLDPVGDSVIVLRNGINDPRVLSISPDTVYKETHVSIPGNNFYNVNSVQFGGVAAESFTVVSPNLIDAVVGPGASGYVTVTTRFGIDSLYGLRFIPQIFSQDSLTFCQFYWADLNTTSSVGIQWYRNGTAIPGATDSTYRVYGEAAANVDSVSGIYTVQATNEGITTTSAGVKVTVISQQAPVLTRDASGLLQSSVTTGNQWFLNGSPLIGDTSQVLRPSQAGTYYVNNTRDGCVSQNSNGYYVALSGVTYLDSTQYIRYFPNPVTSALYVSEYVLGQPVPLTISITDVRGHLLSAGQASNGLAYIDFSNYAPGIYYLHIVVNTPPYTISRTFPIFKVK